MTGQGTRISEIIVRHLAVHLGPNSAKIALKTFAQKTTGHNPEELTTHDVPKLLDGVRPMLAVMIGKDASVAVIDAILKESGAA